MNTPGEKNSYFPDKRLSLREAYNAMYNTDEVVLDDSINNPYVFDLESIGKPGSFAHGSSAYSI